MKFWGEFLKSFIQVTIFNTRASWTDPAKAEKTSKNFRPLSQTAWSCMAGFHLSEYMFNLELPHHMETMLYQENHLLCCFIVARNELLENMMVFRHCIEFWNITVESRSFTYAKSVCNTSENFCISFKSKCVFLWKCPWSFAKLKSHIILHAFISHSSQIFNVTFHLPFIH